MTENEIGRGDMTDNMREHLRRLYTEYNDIIKCIFSGHTHREEVWSDMTIKEWTRTSSTTSTPISQDPNMRSVP